MPEHPYGWLSILPPIAAIALAIVTRRVVLSLIAGLYVGALILAHGNPVWALTALLEDHLWVTATDPTNLRIFSFTLLMGGMIAVLSAAGGMRGLINLITPWAKDRWRGQLVCWFSGLLIFFDDYANTIVLGNTLRPLSDRLRISREKLSFLVDATAAPVAGVAPLSTWVAWEIIQISEGLKGTGVDDSEVGGMSFELFLGSIPYRFYAIWMLLFVPLVALLRRDFGPMRLAEREMVTTGRSQGAIDSLPSMGGDAPSRWYNAALPIGVTLACVVWLLYYTGATSSAEELGAANFEALNAWAKLREILGQADSPKSLAYGALAGLAVASVMASAQRILNWSQIQETVGAGMKTVLPAIAILVTAMTLSGMTKGGKPKPGEQPYAESASRLYTGVFLGQLLLGDEDATQTPQGNPEEEINESNDSTRRTILLRLLPTIVFVLSGVVAFCTGTSFGTMGILMPMTVSLACNILGGVGPTALSHPVLLGTIGAVLAGSIFGDHCSPISDTTVLSSQASGCEHLAHVWTQMPYALTVGAVSILFGTLPLGFGVSVWLLLPLGVVALGVVLCVTGQRIDDVDSPDRE